MTAFQKTVKYLALALAIFLSVSIISGIAGIGIALFSFLESDPLSDELETHETSQSITSLNINISAANFKIKESDKFSIESNLKDLTVNEKEGTLTIKDKKNMLKFNKDAKLIVYVPQDVVFKNVKISVGAGKMEADSIKSERLSINLGAGDTSINHINISNFASIEGGAGKITISDGTIKNLDLKMGTGKLELKSEITGESELDLGVGETILNLIGEESNYSVNVEKGLGKVEVSGKEVSWYETNQGENEIDIEGGIGNITISYHAKTDA